MKLLLMLLSCLLPYMITAQESSPEKLKKQGEEYFSHQKYPEALSALQRYHAVKGATDAILLKIGIAAYHSNDLRLAKKQLTDLVTLKKSTDEETFLYLGKTFHLLHEFKQATEYYKQFLAKAKEKHPQRAEVKENIRTCGVGIRLSIPDKTVLVENLGEKVNSVGDDFAPILSPNYQDLLYFSSCRLGNRGGLRNEKGQLNALEGTYKADMYKTNVVNGEWAATETNEPFLNSAQHDVILDFSTDGSVMYFSKSPNLYSGEAFVDTFAHRDNRGLFPPAFVSPMQMENGDGTPFFFHDSLMLFSSRRAGGFGGLDLYYTVFKNGQWTSPQNLGKNINSAYDESTPFLAQDGKTLYFSSNNSYQSVGGYDIFKSAFNVLKKEWELPVNLGLPINAAGDDTHFRLSKDGFKAYFASLRQGSWGQRDLYTVYFQNPQKEQLLAANGSSFEEILNLSSPQRIKKEVSDGSMETIEIESLFYEDDNDVLSPANIKKINQVIQLLKKYPTSKIGLTCHSSKVASPKFDLYFSIKRLDRLIDYLTQNDINKNRIFIKGVGSNYPIALNDWNNQANPIGQALNKRIDFQFFNLQDLPIEIITQAPIVNENIAVSDFKYYNNTSKNLSYKVQIAAIKQMYQDDLLLKYPNPMIEKFADSELYHYTVGLYKTYSSARQLQQDLVTNGITDAFIVAYINGIRLEKDEIEPFLSEYPDLGEYLSTNSKD